MGEDDANEPDVIRDSGTIRIGVEAFAPEVKIETVWDGVSLAVLLGIYAVIVTVVGVVIAKFDWPWLAGYAGASLAILAALILVERVRRWAVRMIQRLYVRTP
jgi:hypothetical protein